MMGGFIVIVTLYIDHPQKSWNYKEFLEDFEKKILRYGSNIEHLWKLEDYKVVTVSAMIVMVCSIKLQLFTQILVTIWET